MSKANLIILFLLLASCENRVASEGNARFYQGYQAGLDFCEDRKNPSKFELWQGSGVYNKHDNIYDARKALEDCTGKQLLELKTHVDVEQYLYHCNKHEILKKEFNDEQG